MTQKIRREYSERKSPRIERIERIERISYPVPGDSGYDDPIGRKHYQLHPSPIHSLIFNQKEQGAKGIGLRQQLSYSLVDKPISREPAHREPISRERTYIKKDSLDEMLDEYGSHALRSFRFRTPTYLNSEW